MQPYVMSIYDRIFKIVRFQSELQIEFKKWQKSSIFKKAALMVS